jgi:hypothetical protein
MAIRKPKAAIPVSMPLCAAGAKAGYTCIGLSHFGIEVARAMRLVVKKMREAGLSPPISLFLLAVFN